MVRTWHPGTPSKYHRPSVENLGSGTYLGINGRYDEHLNLLRHNYAGSELHNMPVDPKRRHTTRVFFTNEQWYFPARKKTLHTYAMYIKKKNYALRLISKV